MALISGVSESLDTLLAGGTGVDCTEDDWLLVLEQPAITNSITTVESTSLMRLALRGVNILAKAWLTGN